MTDCTVRSGNRAEPTHWRSVTFDWTSWLRGSTTRLAPFVFIADLSESGAGGWGAQRDAHVLWWLRCRAAGITALFTYDSVAVLTAMADSKSKPSPGKSRLRQNRITGDSHAPPRTQRWSSLARPENGGRFFHLSDSCLWNCRFLSLIELVLRREFETDDFATMSQNIVSFVTYYLWRVWDRWCCDIFVESFTFRPMIL